MVLPSRVLKVVHGCQGVVPKSDLHICVGKSRFIMHVESLIGPKHLVALPGRETRNTYKGIRMILIRPRELTVIIDIEECSLVSKSRREMVCYLCDIHSSAMK